MENCFNQSTESLINLSNYQKQSLPHQTPKAITIQSKIMNALSYLFFSWTTESLRLSNSKGLKLPDITSITSPNTLNSKEIFAKLYKEIYPNNLINPNSSPLLSSILRVNRGLLLLVISLSLVQTALKYLHLKLLRQLILLFKQGNNSQSGDISNSIYSYSMLFLGNKLLSIFLSHHTLYLSQRLGISASNSLSGLIYDKLTRTGSFIGSKHHSEGELINFIQHDAETLNFLFFYGPSTLVVPFQFAMYMYLLFQFFGASFFFGFFTFLFLNLIAWAIQKMYIQKQRRLLKNKDERIKLTSNAFHLLKVIKMYSWEDLFLSKINKARDNELQSIKEILNISLITGIVYWSIPLLLSVVSIGVFTLFNGTMAIEDLFTAIDIFDSMAYPLYRFPIFITSFLNTHVSMKRIEKFLFEPDEDKYSNPSEELLRERTAIRYCYCDFGIREYKPGVDKVLLKDISIEIKQGELVAVLGKTGSGKTRFAKSLLNAIHLLPKAKTVNVINGSISYAGQVPWIMNESIRNNILFFNEMDYERYREIIDICQLTADLETLSGGDLTEVSSNGTNVSGGQKARISLARAIYHKADIYVFDDPMSSVDSINGDAIFDKALIKYLKDKTRVLIRHDIKYLHKVDKIVYLAEGGIKWIGKYEDFVKELLYKEMTSLSPKPNDSEDKPRIENEDSVDEGDVNESHAFFIENDLIIKGKLIPEEEQKKGKIGLPLYYSFIDIIGGYTLLFTSIVLTFGLEASQIGGNVWLTQWLMKKKDDLYYYLIFIQFGLLSLFLLFLKEFLFSRGVYNLNDKLHTKMLKRLLNAPINLFHDIVPTGQCINRLTHDLEKCKVTVKLLSLIFKATSALIGALVVCSNFNLYSIIFVPVLSSICFYLTNFYINGGRDFNRLEGIARAPIVEGFSETIAGITTIKAFQAEMFFREKFLRRLNSHLSVSLHKFGALNWYSLHLDLCSFLYLCFIIVFACLCRDALSAQVIGLLLKYSMRFSEQMLQILEQAANFEKSMVSYERCDSYTKVIKEKPKKLSNDVSLSEWPKKGNIRFHNYSARYRQSCDIVFENLNIEIHPGEKIGVVGLSGSGKSTLVQALFRLIEPLNGTIYIDGIDITYIGLKHLRESLSVIPQEAALIEGTLRHNLDPFLKYTDDAIISVLNDLEFFDYINQGNADSSRVLNLRIDVNTKISLGEKQLICFARAILRKSQIVILDEATASLDQRSQEIIQKAMLKHFSSCTVISIAHRVEMVKNCDRILVISRGKVVEFDTLSQLLKSNGLFAKIYHNNILI